MHARRAWRAFRNVMASRGELALAARGIFCMDAFVVRSVPRVVATIALLGALVVAALVGSCSGSSGTRSANTVDDGGSTANQTDAGTPDAGIPDAGTPDAGVPDAGSGTDGGSTDGGTPQFGGPGPWPLENKTYGAAEGIQESPVIAASTDEAQNVWVATPWAIYLMRPGDKQFTRFSSKDGLHLADNPKIYNEDYCGGEKGVPGAANGDGISALVGGAAGEVFVGYHGNIAVKGDCSDSAWDRHSGQLDRVRLKADGTLDVTRFQMVSTGMGMMFWHNRTVYRLAYDHFVHPHTLYAGTDHGVDMFYPDKYRDPNPGEWTGFSIQEWMSDHLHVQVCFQNNTTCASGGEGDSRMGDWRGLAIAPDGDLWHAGRWSAGKIRWVADLKQWNMRSGTEAYPVAYGNLSVPVFPVAQLGDVVSLSAVALAKDGTPWFASSFFYGPVPSVPSPGSGRGLAHDRDFGGNFTYVSPFTAGMSQQDVQDMVGLPDGRLVLAGMGTGLVFWDPATGAHTTVWAGQGIPDNSVQQLALDTMVEPPALYVSTSSGVAVLRQFPK